MVISLWSYTFLTFIFFTFNLVIFYEIDALLCFQHIDQFNILFSPSTQENELMKSIDSCNMEAGVVKTWVNFVEDTCQL
jgi:type IV secretory pathway component VirB8